MMNNLKHFSAATMHEAAGKKGALPVDIKPLHPSMFVFGPAFTVMLDAGDNYFLHHAIYEAPEGSVIVAGLKKEPEFGYWGEIMTNAALQRKISGLIIDGCVRDSKEIIELRFPVFCKGLCIKGTLKKKNSKQQTGIPISIGEVTVNPGDLIVGDADGVVALPSNEVAEIIKNAANREEKEKDFIASIKKGKTTIELFRMEDE